MCERPAPLSMISPAQPLLCQVCLQGLAWFDWFAGEGRWTRAAELQARPTPPEPVEREARPNVAKRRREIAEEVLALIDRGATAPSALSTVARERGVCVATVRRALQLLSRKCNI